MGFQISCKISGISSGFEISPRIFRGVFRISACHRRDFSGFLDFGNGFQVVYCTLCAIHSLLGASAGGPAEGCLEPQYLGEEWYGTFGANRLS